MSGAGAFKVYITIIVGIWIESINFQAPIPKDNACKFIVSCVGKTNKIRHNPN